MDARMDYDPNELICFDDGLFGFEQYTQYLPLPLGEDGQDALCLVSTECEDLSFVVLNPFALKEDYQPCLSPQDYQRLGTQCEEDLSYYVICVLKEPMEESTVNLQCPLVVNATKRKGVQVILKDSPYGMRHRFSKG